MRPGAALSISISLAQVEDTQRAARAAQFQSAASTAAHVRVRVVRSASDDDLYGIL